MGPAGPVGSPGPMGPAGPAGSPGPMGPAGPAGPSDAYYASDSASIPLGNGGPGTSIQSLSLPPGSYVVTATARIVNETVNPGIAYCILNVDFEVGHAIDSIPGLEGVSQSLTVAKTLHSGGTASLYCGNNQFSGNLSLQNFTITAIKVGSLTVQ